MKIKCSDIIADPADNISRAEMNRMNPQDCTSLAAQIDRDGQWHAVTVKPEGDKYRLCAGFQRFTAISIILGWDEIEAQLGPEHLTVHQINALENISQKDRTFWEQCCMLRAIYPDDTEMVQIQKDMKKGKTWVNVRWKAWNLPEEVKQQIAAGLLDATEVRDLMLKGVDAIKAAEKFIAGKAAGKNHKQVRKDAVGRRALQGKKVIQRFMTWCLEKKDMQAVQALRFAIGEIQEVTAKNWLDKHRKCDILEVEDQNED